MREPRGTDQGRLPKRVSRDSRPIGLRPTRKPRPKHDAGFTMVEPIAGLLVATLLIAGVVDIVSRYALTTGEVREAASDIRSARLLDVMMTDTSRLHFTSFLYSETASSSPISGKCAGYVKYNVAKVIADLPQTQRHFLHRKSAQENE